MTRDELAEKILPFAECLSVLLEAEDHIATTAAARAALSMMPTREEWNTWTEGDEEATPYPELHSVLREIAGIPARPEGLQ